MKARISFTLIEMLVVIAVIAILASLLLPALNSTRRTAKSIACKSNMHQLSIAYGGYESDFGVLPATVTADDYHSARWTGKLCVSGNLTYNKTTPDAGEPLATNCKILKCPSAPDGYNYNYGQNFVLAYRMGIAANTGYQSWQEAPLNRAKISKPASRLLLGEAYNPYISPLPYAACMYPHKQSSFPASSPPWVWTLWPPASSMNILYLDFHVGDLSNYEINTNYLVLDGWSE